MQKIDFYQLSRSAQERLVGSINGRGLPAPILRTVSRPIAPLVWLGASAICLLLLIVFFALGYGSLTSRLARQGPAWLLVDVVLAGLVALGLLRALARQREHAASPFRRGIYVFPVGLIDARRSVLRHYPIEDLGAVAGPDARGLTLDFPGASFSFPVRDPALVATAREQLAGARTAVSEAGSARESIRPKALAALDPLRGYANPLASSDSMKRTVPGWIAFIWPLAALTGVMLGGPLWMLRNAKSDDATYARAVVANDADSYRAYLGCGSRHVVEVSSLLLPRALLRDAQKVGTVEAIEQFIKDNPQQSIQAEAQAALKAALLAQLDVAVKEGTLAALDDFAHRHPQARLDAELASARHGVYQAAFARYAATVPDRSSVSLPFVQRLLAWSEKHGPKVEVRFHWKASKTMDKADGAAGKSRQFKGAVSFPSHYFDAAAAKADLDALATATIQRFAGAFPPDVLALTVGDRLADADAPSAAPITAPTLFIEHGAKWTGSMQASQKPRGVFAGLELAFEALFRVPDDTKPVKVDVAAWHLPDLSVGRDVDNPEETIYAAMRTVAFQQFQEKLLRTLLPGAK
jgi:hypothetical protein